MLRFVVIIGFILNYSQLATSVTLKDSRNRIITLAGPPQRIATGFVGADEIAYELLLRSKGLSRLIAVSTLADDPNYSAIAGNVNKIAGRVGSELETLAALKPDLVLLANFNRPEMIMQLEHLGIKTFVLGNFSSTTDVMQNITIIGKLLDLNAEANGLTHEFSSGLDRIAQMQGPASAKSRLISWFSDGSAMGKGTLMDDIISFGGGNNIIGSELGITGWARVSDEKIPLLKPDWIICAGESGQKPRVLATIQRNHIWAQLNAVKTGKLILIPSRYLSSASHHILKAIEIVASQLQADRGQNGKAVEAK